MVGDTEEEARAAQIAALRRLGPSGRVRLAAEMSEDARRIAFEGERRRHPELSATEARRAVLGRMWGAALAASVWSSTRRPPASLDALVRSMAPEQYYVDADAARDALARRSMFNVVDLASGWKVDLIVRKNRPFSRSEFARRMPLTLLDVPVFVASAEDTIVAKVEWSKQSGGSERQRRDVAGILATVGRDLDRDYVERWIRGLDLEEEWGVAQATPA